MVSTRQMSNVGGGPSSSDGPVDAGPSRPTRHNSVIATVASVTMPTVAGPSTFQTVPVKPPRNLLSLPHEVLEKIFVYLGYNKIAQMRTISHQMNQVCSSVLNSTFQRLQTQMLVRFQAIKAKMPRRESARRSHPLACESDIVETLHMRLTLLHMTFGKHIERKHCCFFPGEILDEVYRILHYIKITQKLARPYKVTDELFDLSTMAMEYFKENIEPKLPEIVYFGSEFLDFTGTFSSTTSKNYMCLDTNTISMNGDSKCEEGSRSPPGSPDDRALVTPPPPQSNMVLRKRIRKIKQGMKMYNNQLSVLRHDLRSCKRKTAEQQKQISEQQKQLAEQQKQTLEYATRLDDNDKKNEETSRKFSTLLQELNKCKTELQYWRSKSPTTPQVCTSCGTTITPLAQEDLEALVNQGVKPDDVGLAMDGPSSDFIPIVGNEESLGTELWEGIELAKVVEVVEEKEVKIGSPRASHSGVKRKMEEQITPSLAQADPTPSKKPKRGLKTRCGKVRNK